MTSLLAAVGGQGGGLVPVGVCQSEVQRSWTDLGWLDWPDCVIEFWPRKVEQNCDFSAVES